MTHTVSGYMTVDRKYWNEGIENDYEVDLTISGEVEPADPSSGIFAPYVAAESIRASSEDDNDFMLTDKEVERAADILGIFI